ncbi:MAG: ABC transporter permease [Bacteroidia bacterium]
MAGRAQTVQEDKWSLIIQPKTSLFHFGLRELIDYRDLLYLLVRRDIVTVYKQTLLGFFWFVVPPVLNALTYLIIFGLFAKIDNGAGNLVLFYLSGVIAWSFFADCINRTATTFRANASIFGKVYFPRLIVPLAAVISAMVKFFVQFAFLLAVVTWFGFTDNPANIQWPNLWLLPVVILLMGLLGMSLGIIISSLTTKYRDLSNIVPFSVQFLMYMTPVIYPYTFFPEKWQWVFDVNPMAPLIETFRHLLLGSDRFIPVNLLWSLGFALILLFVGLILFNRTQRNFMDTV